MQVDEVAHLVPEEQGTGAQISLMFGPGHEQALLLLQLQARPLRLVALELRVCRQAAGGGIGQLPVRHLTGWRQIGIGIAQQGGLIEPAFRGPGDLAGLHVPVELAFAALVARVLQVGHGIQLGFIDAGRASFPVVVFLHGASLYEPFASSYSACQTHWPKRRSQPMSRA